MFGARPISPCLLFLWVPVNVCRCRQRGRPFHDLRHTYATTLLQERLPIKIVSQRLGHANVMITLQVYAYVMLGDDEVAAVAVARIYGDAVAFLSTTFPDGGKTGGYGFGRVIIALGQSVL